MAEEISHKVHENNSHRAQKANQLGNQLSQQINSRGAANQQQKADDF